MILTAIITAITTIAIIAWKYLRKIKETEKLKIGAVSLSAVKPLDSISNIIDALKNGLQLQGYVVIRNFSSEDFVVSQISLDIFSPKEEKLVAEQVNIMKENKLISKRAETKIPLEYNVDVLKVLSLFKESEVIPEGKSLLQIIKDRFNSDTEFNLRKLQIILRGFIEAEGITLKIDEKILLYD